MIWLAFVWILVASFLAVRVGRLLSPAAEPQSPFASTERDASAESPAPDALDPGRRTLLDQAIETLDRHDTKVAKIALLSWIGGLSAAEIGAVLNVEAAAVERDLQTAREVLRGLTPVPRARQCSGCATE